MITLKDLFQQTSWQQVFESLQEYYPDDLKDNCEGLQYAFEEIQELKPETNNDNMILQIKYKERDGYNYYDVCGFKNNETYALDFSPWEEWLGLYIDENLFHQYSNADIITHAIWEATFYGFDQEHIKQEKDELMQRVEEARNGMVKWLKTSEVVKNCFK